MSNEFVIRDGFSTKDVIITGSLKVTGFITASLQTASYAHTASYSINSLTASTVQSANSASYSMYAETASYAEYSNYSVSTLNSQVLIPTMSTVVASDPGFGYLCPINTLSRDIVNLAATTVTSANTLNLTPIVIPKSGVLKRIGMHCRLVSSPTGSIRLGVYTNNTSSLLPSTLVVDAGLIYPPATFNMREIILPDNSVTLEADTVYWLAFSLCENVLASNIGYPDNSLATTLFSTTFNKYFNPLLGSAPPLGGRAIRGASMYTTALSSTSSLPTTLPDNPQSYSTVSFFNPVPPLILVQ